MLKEKKMLYMQHPEQYNFSKSQKWLLWIQRFERYIIDLELCLKPEETQVNMLLQCVGTETDKPLKQARKKLAAIKL